METRTTAPRRADDRLLQSGVIGGAEAGRRVLRKAGGTAERRVRVVAVDEIARACLGEHVLKGQAFQGHIVCRPCARYSADVLGVADAG